jgi:hypothetical protein
MIRSLRASHKLRNQLSFHSLQHLPLSLPLHLDQQNENKFLTTTRNYSLTARNENALIIGGISILAVAGGLHVGMSLYNQYQQKKSSAPSTEESQTESTTNSAEDKSKVDETTAKASSANANEKTKTDKKTEEATGSGGIFGNFFATTFYDGGFGKSLSFSFSMLSQVE